MKKKLSTPFLTLGIAFVAIGASSQRNLFGVGIVFFVLGLVFLIRERRNERKR